MRKDINISEVAKKAGVSIATVSRVFNNSGPVKESTRKAIQKIIEETGYLPNVLARELAEKRTNLVGMIVHNLSGEGMSRAIEGVNRVLDSNSYSLLMTCSNGSLESERKHFELLRLKRVDGIIFATRSFKEEHKDMIEKLPVPVVVMLQNTENAGVPFVAFANTAFAKGATQKLIELGHREVAFLGGPEDSVNANERKRGFIEALEDAGIAVEEDFICHGNYHIESGYEQMKTILKRKKIFTAVVAVNDGMAIGALNCLQDHDVKVPEEVSVLGLDDTVLAKASRLKLSGVHYSYNDLGFEAAQMLLKQMQSEVYDFEKKVLPYEIHLRESVQARTHYKN
ncbi:LacI family transcriptional regulator [Jeotgalibacillus sp. S-D1]|uniref:LacI family DNA-binding transcriptional regulator n=1 Tax=Jeotgalibacillus sp. S-D1 TaxID=2552189 RepID=UPI001059BC03|nr:LacI family DNA-binding transcriptional regulator [Jeotgalibacillus sp. S-D1]TDL31271.1 LacI family transcriptional regulator [Jeotgalibacillus sp. S-D1]